MYAHTLRAGECPVSHVTNERVVKRKGTIRSLHNDLKPHQRLIAEIIAADGGLKRVPLTCRIDTVDELEYYKNGGILQYVLRHLAA